MSSEAKKIRVFEPDCLTAEEKKFAVKIKKSHKFTSQTPRFKYYFLRQFIFGVGVINLLLGSGQLLAISLILEYLNPKEFVKLAACADPSLLRNFWYEDSKLFEKFRREHFRLPCFNLYFPSAKRLLALQSGQALLREYYIFRHPKNNWKIDWSTVLPNSYIECVAFNPEHPLVALLITGKIYVVAYGGKERSQKGQLFFATGSAERYYGINWSPSGEYLLALQGKETTKISLFWYDCRERSVSEVSTFPSEKFESCSGLNTKHLWIDGSTLMFASIQKYVMAILKLNGRKKQINFSWISLKKTMEKIDGSVNDKIYIHMVSNFFVLPNPNSSYLYFLVSCGKNGHQHQRIVYIDKITLEAIKWVDLPGEAVEITVSSDRFYVLLQERKEVSYMHNQPSVFSDVTNLATDFPTCGFSESWRLNKSCKKHEPVNTKIVVCDESVAKIFHERCFPGHKLAGITCTLTPDSNKKYDLLKETLFAVSSSNMMYVTKDYLYHTNPMTKETQVYGVHHEFKYKIETEKEINCQFDRIVAWFHPSSSIFIQTTPNYFFGIYLNEKLATEEEKNKFPMMNVFEYKSKTVFAFNGPSDLLS